MNLIITRLLGMGLGFILLFSQLALASWPTDAVYYADTFRYGIDDLGFTDTYEASIFGSAKARLFMFDSLEKGMITVPGVFKKPLPYVYHFQTKRFYSEEMDDFTSPPILVRYEKRPLVIYIPGIFNNAKDSQNRRALEEFRAQGYHTVVLPNPWSEHYIKADPFAAKPGDVVHEADTLLRTIEAVLGTINPDFVDGVELIGASYGGFIAGMISALDTKNLFNRGTTIISPPLDFRYSLPFMDELIESEIDKAYEMSRWDQVQIGTNYLTAKNASSISEKSRRNSKPFLAKTGFHAHILETLRAYDKVHKAGWIPKFASGEQKKDWEKSRTFMGYFNENAPELLHMLESDYSDLGYWVDSALSQGKLIRIITTNDDFLNPPFFPTKEDFDRLPKNIFLRLPSGGHLGFLALPWYKDFRQKVWPQL